MTTPVWVFTYEAGLDGLVADALIRCSLGDWQTGDLTQRSRDVLGITLETARGMALLAGSVQQHEGTVVIEPYDPGAPPERREAAVKLYAAIAALAFADAASPAPPKLSTFETSGFPAVAIAIVGVAQAAALAFVADRAAAVADRVLARNATARTLLQEHAQALKLVEAHADAEKAAGKSLPMSPALSAALDKSAARAKELTTELGKAQPLPSPFSEASRAAAGALSTPLLVVAALVAAAAVVS